MTNKPFAPALTLLAGLLVLIGTNPAQAAVLNPLPDALYYNGALSIFTLKTAGRSSGVSSSSSTTSASTQNNYDTPYLSAAGNSPAGGGALGESYLQYWMRIIGPTDTVQVLFQAAGQTSAEGSQVFPKATLDIIGGKIDGANGLSFAACSNCAGASSFFVNRTYTFETNSAYRITMDAQVSAVFGSGTAWVDPFFGVPDGYTISFSDGIGNAPLVTAVPEPTTWAMMVLGFAGIGLLAYRRRRDPSLSAV